MHELSIVIDLVALFEENLRKNNKNKIEEVHLKIGRLSGVEPHLLKSAYEVYQKDTVCKDAKLIINLQDVVVKCNKCGKESVLNKNEFLCPKCGSNDLEVLDGEDMYLMQLVMS